MAQSSCFLNCIPVVYELLEYLPFRQLKSFSKKKVPQTNEIKKLLQSPQSYSLGLRIVHIHFYSPYNRGSEVLDSCNNALGTIFLSTYIYARVIKCKMRA